LVDPVTPVQELEERRFVIAVQALPHRLVVSLAYVEEPVTIAVEVGVKTEVGAPRRISVVIQRDPWYLDLKNVRHRGIVGAV
jgi:hypothetical protein